MTAEYWYSLFAGVVPKSALHLHEPMARHTTFMIGGPADLYIEPETEAELAAVLRLAAAEGVPLTVLGGGSNVLVRDGGIRGVTVGLCRMVKPFYRRGDSLFAAGGMRMSRVVRRAAQEELAGLEFAVGIPGTVGGAVWMNAGAYGGEMCEVVASVTAVTRRGERVVYDREELGFGYRRSRFQESGDIVTEVEFALRPGVPAQIAALMDDYTERRRRKQPLDFPSAGSTFKRPAGYYAGTLIEQTGLKGLRCGGACVSTLHAGFVINDRQATARDVLALIDEVRARVRVAHGVELEPEVRIFGEDLPAEEVDRNAD